MNNKDGNELEQVFGRAVHSHEFRKGTALLTLTPVAAGALGVAVGCAGFGLVYGDVACDPLRYQRHHEHIEEVSTATGAPSLSATDGVMLVFQGNRARSNS